jgi:hypothetical protein
MPVIEAYNMFVDAPVREVRDQSAQYRWSSIKRLPKRPREMWVLRYTLRASSSNRLRWRRPASRTPLGQTQEWPYDKITLPPPHSRQAQRWSVCPVWPREYSFPELQMSCSRERLWYSTALTSVKPWTECERGFCRWWSSDDGMCRLYSRKGGPIKF